MENKNFFDFSRLSLDRLLNVRRIELQELISWSVILTIFLIGLWLIVIRPLGPNFSRLPGDLGDTRFNNYILEHDFRWITGQDESLWNAPFFYPYPNTLAFSDNHLGSMLFYSVFRWAGLNRETALQYWYVLSYLLNFGACAYVLKRLDLKPLAIGMGAFFFTFGLPVLAQEGHLQLSYRYCIPLASYFLWLYSQERHLKALLLVFLWSVWQFYISIYLGYFMCLLLVALASCIPFAESPSFLHVLQYWPKILKESWKKARKQSRIYFLVLLIILSFVLGYLFSHYVSVSHVYGFSRSWEDVSKMLPRIQSYLISDHSKLWQPLAYLTSTISDYRHEHQLFIGVSGILLLIVGLVWRFEAPNKKIAVLFLGSAGLIILLTLHIGNFSLYKIFWNLPGINSIRAVTRVILVFMWPISLFIAVEADALLRNSSKSIDYRAIVLLFLCLMVVESVFFRHASFSKEESNTRLQNLHEQIPERIPDNPLLIIWNPDESLWYLPEIDAMLLSQDLGWPVLNGYSGNLPDGYGPTKNCDQAVLRIIAHMQFQGIYDPLVYESLASKIVSIGPAKCKLPRELPSLSLTDHHGPFSEDLYAGILIQIISLKKEGNYLYVDVEIENLSPYILPARSSSGNPFRLSWRFIDFKQETPLSSFENRKDLIADILPGGRFVETIILVPPTEKGQYSVEVSAVQEGVAWFHDRGMVPARSEQTINVKGANDWIIAD